MIDGFDKVPGEKLNGRRIAVVTGLRSASDAIRADCCTNDEGDKSSESKPGVGAICSHRGFISILKSPTGTAASGAAAASAKIMR